MVTGTECSEFALPHRHRSTKLPYVLTMRSREMGPRVFVVIGVKLGPDTSGKIELYLHAVTYGAFLHIWTVIEPCRWSNLIRRGSLITPPISNCKFCQRSLSSVFVSVVVGAASAKCTQKQRPVWSRLDRSLFAGGGAFGTQALTCRGDEMFAMCTLLYHYYVCFCASACVQRVCALGRRSAVA